MFIFSETLNSFVAKQVLELKTFAFPEYKSLPKIIIYESNDKTLGKYFQQGEVIALQKSLMFEKQEVVSVVLKHEYAHFLVHKKHGPDVLDHGKEFRHFCRQLGIAELDKQSMEELQEIAAPLAAEALINKVKKLLKLASSSNPHEAQAATLKANQLLLKYNLTEQHIQDAPEIYMQAVYTTKRSNVLVKLLGSLVRQFNVYPVIVSINGGVELQISGTRANVEISQYVVDFFITVIEDEWSRIKTKKIKGLRAKNSLIRGLVTGFLDKTKSQDQVFSTEDQSALVVYRQVLEHKVKNVVYAQTKLVNTKSKTRINPQIYQDGYAKGKTVSINPGIKSSDETKLIN